MTPRAETTVVIAVQDAGRAKSRLGPDLDPGMRRTLVIAMLDDLLTALREVHVGPVTVVSADAVYDAIAREHGAQTVRDAGVGYNTAVLLALQTVTPGTAVLILPGDLPQATATDLATLLAAIATPGVVIAPSADGGTCALGLHPVHAITPAFGPDSARLHREAAVAAGAALTILALESLSTDVDTLDDLADVWDRVGEATTALLEHLPLPAKGTHRD
ncbi:MAG: 2-phospho-L-lactate guanylyltransferase [Dehalococcoidia bacterium]|nr:2-phospho-L-lactate guanylyltransferase [Dehalococcoidia bacterium]